MKHLLWAVLITVSMLVGCGSSDTTKYSADEVAMFTLDHCASLVRIRYFNITTQKLAVFYSLYCPATIFIRQNDTTYWGYQFVDLNNNIRLIPAGTFTDWLVYNRWEDSEDFATLLREAKEYYLMNREP